MPSMEEDLNNITLKDLPKLTVKQRKWLDVYIETGNATEAAMQAYNCKDRNSAKSIGFELLTKLDFGTLMELMGLSDSRLLKKADEGLEATRTISVMTGSKAKGTDTDFIDVPDYAIRHKYLETNFKLKNRLTGKLEVSGVGGQPIVVASTLTPEQERALVQGVAGVFKEIYGQSKSG